MFRCLLIMAVFFQISCSSESDVNHQKYKYISVQTNGDFSILFDFENMGVTPLFKGLMDTVPIRLEVCEESSKYICFSTGLGNIVFAIPKDGVTTQETWVIDGVLFKLKKKYFSPNCGPNYIIESSVKEITTMIFVFNYNTGLRSISPIIEIEKVELEYIDGVSYKFGATLLSDGFGIGGSGICS